MSSYCGFGAPEQLDEFMSNAEVASQHWDAELWRGLVYVHTIRSTANGRCELLQHGPVWRKDFYAEPSKHDGVIATDRAQAGRTVLWRSLPIKRLQFTCSSMSKKWAQTAVSHFP
ncbi:hypothetical protein F2P81_005391 [Scophthalmus maximus]|uniref:Uncharacterized protein n=1 Tax=Scophthalmus maximus TaxID=52904 RepID=A0A6A4TAF6_SCOMX|nr:hypothetical protein F2P81_005391 [Scophthalmus maximus]